MRSYLLGISRFVVVVFVKTDGEGLYWLGALHLHQRHYGAGINPPGKKSAQWDIGDHAQADGPLELLFKLTNQFCVTRLQPRIKARFRTLYGRPVTRQHRLLLGRIKTQDASGGQFEKALVNTMWRGNVIVTHI